MKNEDSKYKKTYVFGYDIHIYHCLLAAFSFPSLGLQQNLSRNTSEVRASEKLLQFCAAMCIPGRACFFAVMLLYGMQAHLAGCFRRVAAQGRVQEAPLCKTVQR